MSDDDNRWEKNVDGALKIALLSEFEARSAADLPQVLVRLLYYPPGNDPPDPPSGRLQLQLGPNGARALGERLIAVADEVQARGPLTLN